MPAYSLYNGGVEGGSIVCVYVQGSIKMVLGGLSVGLNVPLCVVRDLIKKVLQTQREI